MSSSSHNNNIGAGERKWFFCYTCNRNVYTHPSHHFLPLCPICNEGLLQECRNDNILSHLALMLPDFVHTARTLSPSVRSRRSFDLQSFLDDDMNNLSLNGGEHGPMDNHSSRAMQVMHYLRSNGMEEVARQLEDNDSVWYGNPPASRKAIESLSTINVSVETLSSEKRCIVCLDDFVEGGELKQMPCMHIYHADCILQWLRLHNSCPVCRFELPGDDDDQECEVSMNAGLGNEGGNDDASEGMLGPFLQSLPMRYESPVRSNSGESSSNVRRESSRDVARVESGMEEID